MAEIPEGLPPETCRSMQYSRESQGQRGYFVYAISWPWTTFQMCLCNMDEIFPKEVSALGDSNLTDTAIYVMYPTSHDIRTDARFLQKKGTDYNFPYALGKRINIPGNFWIHAVVHRWLRE